MRATRNASILLLSLLLAGAAIAEEIGGTVTNGTTGKPAAGVAVTLVDPMGGMAEIATTKSDGHGHFSFSAPTAQGPRLVRAEKSGVNYFKMITPGSTSVDLSVYDAAAKVEGITGSADVVRLQTSGSNLQADELFAVRNESSPPRTLASDATFEFVVPDGAQIDGADAQAPNGQPIEVKTAPTKEKNHYAFSFALKPGETRFQVAYHLPYSGSASFSPRLTRNFDHYVLVLPTSMGFVPKDASQFHAMTNQPGSNVQVSLKAQAGQDLSFTVSGTGTVQDEQAQSAPSGGTGAGAGNGPMAEGAGGTAPPDNRPGGGLGKPGEEPDSLAKYSWQLPLFGRTTLPPILLTLLTVLLVGGGIWTHERTKQEQAEAFPAAAPAAVVTLPSAPKTKATAPPTASGNLLLTALKEELFELEIERQQGKLSAEEYGKARAALEQTLQRALTRKRG